jgi:hypothetical protein
MKDIFKTKLQLIPIVTLFVFVVILITLGFQEYPNKILAGLAYQLLIFFFGIFLVLFIFSAVFIFIKSIMNKDGKYYLLKKLILVSIELVIVLCIIFIVKNKVLAFFKPSEDQMDKWIEKNNSLQVGGNISAIEISSVRKLLEKKTGDMGIKPYSPYPDRVLKILKLNKLCNPVESRNIKQNRTFSMCLDGDFYVEYGMDRCFPNSFDCVGERNLEFYLIRNENGNYSTKEKKY